MCYYLHRLAAPALLFLVALFLAVVLSCDKPSGADSFEPVVDQTFLLEKEGESDPIAVAGTGRGGIYTTWGGPFPRSLNYWLDNWHLSAEIMGLLFEPLITLHSTKSQAVGILARSWDRGGDGRTFTFHLHPEARWSDGHPVDAGDILFFYDTIMDPKNRTTPTRVYLSRFERPQVINNRTIQMRSKERYWKAFWDAGSFRAFPEHIWKGKDFNRINFEFPVVNGPYQLQTVKRNRFALLKRRGDWWGRILRYNQNKYNFDYIRYRFMEDRVAALEAFKKGNFDLYSIYTSSIWAQQTDFEQVRKNWVARQEIYNQRPKSFQGFAINLRRKKFQDIRLRKALCHLLNRKQMNEKLMFQQYFLLNSYFPDLYPNNQNPATAFCNYDLQQARSLLDAAGWKVGPNGIRQREGKNLEIAFITYSPDLRHYNIYVEDLKRAGITARVEQLSKATITERIQNFQFDLFWINTGASRLRDPEPLFSSRFADQVGSSNLSGLKDKKVDLLLDQLRQETAPARRISLLKKLDLRLAELMPYVLLWQADRTRLLYWRRFETPATVLSKYDMEEAAIVYWWFDRQKAKQLEEAQRQNSSLSSLPLKVHYRKN